MRAKKRTTWTVILTLICISLGTTIHSRPLLADKPQSGLRALSASFRHAAKTAMPSVVTVLAYGNQSEKPAKEGDALRPKLPPFLDGLLDSVGDSLVIVGIGSGVILSDDGVIVTNSHVVKDAQKLIVRMYDGRQFETSDFKQDPESDVATLRLNEPNLVLQPAQLGDADKIEIGDWVIAIGSPFRLETSVSAGIISAKGRTLTSVRRGTLLQTDAAINPGSSGGALVDLDGKVIGLNTVIATRNGSYQGIGFAIPINQVRWIANQLIQHGHVRRAALGIRLVELNAGNAEKLGLPVGAGVVAYQIIDGSAAAKSGILPMDIIVSFAGKSTRKSADLQKIVERMPVGSIHTAEILRKGAPIKLQVTLAPREDPTKVSEISPTEKKSETPVPEPTDSDKAVPTEDKIEDSTNAESSGSQSENADSDTLEKVTPSED